MRLATTYTRAPLGLAAPEVTVEVHLAGGLPAFHIVGLIETAVRESRERVRAAIRQSGFDFPDGRVLVNLAPADMPKSGSRFDLAIAIGVLAASGQVPAGGAATWEYLGELAFSGALRTVPGVLPALLGARAGSRGTIVPAAAALEARLTGTVSRLAPDLASVARFLREEGSLLPAGGDLAPGAGVSPDQDVDRPDLADVVGQSQARRALEIAAAGGHHLLLTGPPGTGKTLLAHRLPGLLPPLDADEALEAAALRSLLGLPLDYRQRPFRAPHHTASVAALVGGGGSPRPGEISLAHRGVLLLDELPEFSRPALESLREPLTTGRVSIARARRALEFPAEFQLVATMNPCPCGYHGDPARACECTPQQVRSYHARLSGPLLDRVDLMVVVQRPSPKAVPAGEGSGTVAARVLAARSRQRARQGVLNARLVPASLARDARISAAAEALLRQAAERLALSARAQDSMRRVARTIGDLAESEEVKPPHVAEAISLRLAGELRQGTGRVAGRTGLPAQSD